MSSCRKRHLSDWHVPLTYAGVAFSSGRQVAANDNLPLQGKCYARLAMMGLAATTALSFAGAGLILVGGLSGWW
jgi:hypothetical protein